MPKDGLEELIFIMLREENSKAEYDEWVFNQLVSKASNLKKLEITNMMMTKCPNNRQTFFNVAMNFIEASNCLRELKISKTHATAEMGKDFLSKLAETETTTLEHLDFEHNPSNKFKAKWFNEDQESADMLEVLLKRNEGLKTLNLVGCNMNEQQTQ